MNRQDFGMVLNQVDNVGDTLMRNRMNAEAKQERTADRDLRERMFTEQQATRKELQTQNAAWKTQNEDQQTLQMIIRANADGSLDDAAIAKANEWIMQHPQLGRTGIQLTKPVPKEPGTMETSQTRNSAELKKLQAAIRAATTPEAKAQAEQDLADFKSLLPGRAGGETEETKPDAGAMTALTELQKAWADAVKNNNREEADRIGASIDATRKKWNINPSGPGTATQSASPTNPAPAAQQQDPDDSQTDAVNVDVAIEEAQAAIRAGAPRDKVIARLKKLGITVQ